jgi:hypothetical protein
MNEIIRTGGAVAPVQLDPMAVAAIFRQSGMFPDIQSEAQAATKIIIGRGLGLTDFDAMSGLHIIKGKAVLAANLMAAAIKRSGRYDYRVSCNTDVECVIEFYSGANRIGESRFSMEDAKRAGLGGDNWRKYPRAMLFARCISAGYKTHCPDALGAAPVYVEAHGEKEIPDDPPAKSAPQPAKALTREERRADTERLLAPVATPPGEIPIDGGTDAVPVEPPDVVTLTPKATKLSRVGNSDWFRVDVAGEDRPFAIKDAKVAHDLEASLAFNATVRATFTTRSDNKRVIVKLEDIGHG